MIQQLKNISKKRHQNHLEPAFLTAEALVASVIFAVILTGTIKIIEQQNKVYRKTIILHNIHSAIILDSKAIRHYATLWNSYSENPDEPLYDSPPGCILFARRNSIETAYRSDSPNYNRRFPFAPTIQQNNAVIATISDGSGNTYKVRRTYVNRPNNPNLETDTATLRVKYSVEEVSENGESDVAQFEHTMDVNLTAQYHC